MYPAYKGCTRLHAVRIKRMRPPSGYCIRHIRRIIQAHPRGGTLLTLVRWHGGVQRL